MRTLTVFLAVLSLAWPAHAQDAPAFEPYSAYVAPEAGLLVREAPRQDAPVLATLWQGARVFVRDGGGDYVRIDGYGVAGFAFVDERFLTIENPASIEPASVEPAALGARTGSASR